MGRDSAAERSQGAGHRGVSAEQGGDVMRISAGKAAARRRLKKLAHARLAASMKSNRGAQHCGRRAHVTGMRAARNMRGSGMGLETKQSVASTGDRNCGRRGKGRRRRVALGFEAWRRRIFATSANGRNRKNGSAHQTELRWANWFGRSIQLDAMFPADDYPLVSTLADDRHSRAGGRREEYPRGFATAHAGSSCGGSDARHSGVLSSWRSAGRLRLWPMEHETFARVDKIVGPGNLYVTAAKKLVSFDCAIDMLAGPTEGCHRERSRQASFHRRRPGGAGRA